MKTDVTAADSSYTDNHQLLLQLIKQRVGCSDTAEDLVQEAYLRVIQKSAIEKIANLPGYLYRVAINLTSDYLRQPSVRNRDGQDISDDQWESPRPTPDQIVQAQQELETLERLIEALPPQCQKIFLMRRVLHLSHAQIAEQLHISPRTVESQVCKALRILRDQYNSPDAWKTFDNR